MKTGRRRLSDPGKAIAMSTILISPSDHESTAASVVVAAYGRSSTGGTAVADDRDDPFIETPMEFLPVEAHPDRGLQDEPSGSGPFGF
jgi:hypothetical protein